MKSLAALFLGLGALAAAGWYLYRAEQALYAAPPPPVAPVARLAPATAPAPGTAPNASSAFAPAPGPAADAPVVPATGDGWLQATVDALLEQHPELQLNAAEVARLKDVYVFCQHVRTAFEAEVAEVFAISDTHARIRIPPYPKAGARLEQLWVEEMTAELGAERFDEVDARLGETMELAFKGFGTSVQMLDVELRRDPELGLLYRIVASIDHFDPGDPAAGGAPVGLLTTTTQYRFPAAAVATGEWRPLARHFPRLPES